MVNRSPTENRQITDSDLSIFNQKVNEAKQIAGISDTSTISPSNQPVLSEAPAELHYSEPTFVPSGYTALNNVAHLDDFYKPLI